MATDTTVKYLLDESQLSPAWYNVQADLPTPLPPPLHPGTGQPIGPDDLAPLFPMELIAQEVSQERYIEIPQAVQDVYRLWRPTPLFRARALEKELDLPSNVKIFYKYEGVSPSGSHKPNTAVPQAYYNKEAGVTRIATETGAGQWGSSLAMACAFFGIDLKVYMVKISFAQKPYRRAMMETWGAECVASPSMDTNAGRAILAADPDSTGSLGIAISEAVEDAATREDTKYALGSVLNHVLMHQTVIGQEAIKQLEMADAEPDVIIGCAGGGSNFAGLVLPFMPAKFAGGRARIIAVEPAACPTLTRGVYAYDFGDTAGTASENAHAGSHLHARGHPRGRSALPRHGPADQSPLRSWVPGSAGGQAGCRVRSGGHIRALRRNHSGPGTNPCHPRRHRRGPDGQRSRRGQNDPL
jgi:tryptophan synthase beta chain